MLDGPFDSLVKYLSCLPGLGPRSARRIALHLLTRKDGLMVPLTKSLIDAAQNVKVCATCGTIDSVDPCRICRDAARNPEILCVVAGVADLWAIEKTKAFRGKYHILGGLLSALDGRGPEQLSIARLESRIAQGGITEVILALSATVEGQSTAHLVVDRLAGLNVRVTRLGRGVPAGGELHYLDDGTIAAALKSRAQA